MDEDRKLRVLIYTSDKVACSWQRALLPGFFMRKLGLADVEFGEREDYRLLDWADVVLYQRFYTGRPYMWWKEMYRRGTKLVYELDDNMWEIPDDNPFKPFYDKERMAAIEDMSRSAHLVTVPSMGLAQYMTRFNKNVAIIPNGIDPAVLEMPKPKAEGEIRLCFCGSKTHDRDFAPLLGVLPGLFRKHPQLRFVLIGQAPKGLGDAVPKDRLIDKGWVTFEGDAAKKKPSIYEVMAGSGVDIGLVPLKESEFNRGKSHIKFVEYGAMRATVLASDVGIYREVMRDGENGLIVRGNSPLQWEKALERVISDAMLREKLSAEAHAEVEAKYTYNTIARQWRNALRTLLPGGG